MRREELLDQLTQDIIAYVMQGGFPDEELADSIKPQGLDDRFNDYELLLDLHFILMDDVVEFVRTLPQNLRQLRTETERISRTCRGTIDGQINWGSTIKQRYSENPRDLSMFVCENRSEDYDIAENLVLRKVLSVIYTTLRESEEYLREEYEWVQETWRGNEELIDELQRVVDRNVHVRRIREPEAYEPTERMLTTAENSRQQVYREAARLLRTRDRLFDAEEDELHRLLNETAITPDDENTLFELFVLFRFVSTLETMQGNQPQFSTIATDRQEIAYFEGSPEIVLYHDNSARDRGLSFVSEPDAKDRPLSRSEKVQSVAQSVANNYFQSRRDFTNHTGRPDLIVLEIISDSDDREYLITEVKNSANIDTVRRGIKETLQYLAFLRVNGEFVFGSGGSEDYFGTGWNGALVIQDLSEKTASIDDQNENEIKILQASELDEELEPVLNELI